MFTQSSTEDSRFHSAFPWLISELFYETKADHVTGWATTSMTERLQKQNNYPSLFFLADIQECYEVTLQLNKEQTVVKEDSRQDAWEVIFFPSPHYWAYVYIVYAVTYAVTYCLWPPDSTGLLCSQHKVSLPVSLTLLPRSNVPHESVQLWLQPVKQVSNTEVV